MKEDNNSGSDEPGDDYMSSIYQVPMYLIPFIFTASLLKEVLEHRFCTNQ